MSTLTNIMATRNHSQIYIPPENYVERLLTVSDWFTINGSGSQGFTARGPLVLPHGTVPGWRIRWDVKAGQLIKARIENGPTFTWGGQPYVVAVEDGKIWSDPNNTIYSPGASPILRVYTASPSGGQFLFGKSYDPQRTTHWAFGDLQSTDGISGMYTGAGPSIFPSAIVGYCDPTKVSHFLVGDSIIASSAGFTENAAREAMHSGYSVGAGGDGAGNLVSQGLNRISGMDITWFTHVLHQHAINDTAGGWPGSGNSLLGGWNWAQSYGLKSIQTTCTPWTTSTDSYTTYAGQTPAGNTAIIQSLNSWLRSGAPILNNEAVANGTPNAIYVGHPNHPCDLIVDTGAAIQAPTNPSLAELGTYSGTDGVHPAPYGHLLLKNALVPALQAL